MSGVCMSVLCSTSTLGTALAAKPKPSTKKSVVKAKDPFSAYLQARPLQTHYLPSIPAPEMLLRSGWSSCTPKSAHEIPPSCSCLPLQPCKGLL